jgi:hypothetical protein
MADGLSFESLCVCVREIGGLEEGGKEGGLTFRGAGSLYRARRDVRSRLVRLGRVLVDR